jgi:tetratricopeptide (TPR) repeat protein
MPRKVKRPVKKAVAPEEALLFFDRVGDVFIKNWRLFAIALVVAGLIVFAVLSWVARVERRETYASFLLSQGIAKLKEGDSLTGEEANKAYAEGLERLSNLVEEYNSTESGELGLLYLGKNFSRLKRYGEAIERYEEFLSLDGSNALYRSIALLSLGSAYQSEKNYAKAAECFRELTQMEAGFLRADSILAQARVYEEMEQPQEALAAYKDFLEQYPDSSESNQIRRKVALLESHL